MAVKPSRLSGDTSGLAFLDVITCGFGAVILLLIIAKPGPSEVSAVAPVPPREPNIVQVTEAVTRLRAQWEALRTRDVVRDVTPGNDQVINQAVRVADQRLKALHSQHEGLEQVRESLRRATLRIRTPVQTRDPAVGGIPVDSEYVIFIIDTSGSMQGIWPQVMETVGHVLDIHPTVRGFQVLNDNGGYLMSAYKKKWIADTPRRRKGILKVMQNWKAFSNSSPVEGLQVALRTYASQKAKIAIYVFGDDYSGNTYDEVMTALQTFNTNHITGKRKVRVHAIGFVSRQFPLSFATLMREVTRTNNGAFLALPIRDARGNVGVAQPVYDETVRTRTD